MLGSFHSFVHFIDRYVWDVLVKVLSFQVKWTAEQLMEEHMIFGDFFDLDNQSHGRIYRPITDQNKIRQTLEEFYMRMNFGNTKV